MDTTPQTATNPSTVRYFHRDGSPCKRRVRVESEHVATYQVQDACDRCGGAGGGPQWSHTGWTCYACGGNGKGKIRTVKVYSAEKLAKLVTAEEKRNAKKQAARIAEARLAAEHRQATRREILAANPGLETALAVDHRICRELAEKLDSHGSLSPAQIALALKIAAEINAPKATKIDPPTGRQTVEGVVVSLKEIESDYGYDGGWGRRSSTWKMLVAVTAPAGEYRVFGTVPSALPIDGLKGSRVRLTATIQPKEPGFGFYSRPSGAEIVEPATTASEAV